MLQPGMMKIFTALVNQPEGLTFTELGKVVHLSDPVISEYLAKMQEQGVVSKDPENRRYGLAKIYYPMEAFANDYQKALKIFSAIVVKKGLEISEMTQNPAREEAFRLFLESAFQYFTVLGWKIIGEAIATFSGKQDLRDQDLVVKMNATINEAFRDWISPIANSLAVSIALNLDIIGVGDGFFNDLLKRATEDLDKLRDLRGTTGDNP
jgi:predicted transcriptional regulator